MRRIVVLVASLGLLGLPSSASSAQRQIRCSYQNLVSNSEARFSCTVRHLRRNEAAEARAEQGCSRFRSFYAEDANPYISSSAFHERPGRFDLRDKGFDERLIDDEDDSAPLYVSVYATNSRVKFVNHSRYLVNVSYSMRCPI